MIQQSFTYRDPDCTPDLEQRLRLLRDSDENGIGCVLVTSLMDSSAFSAQDIIQVYRRRWGIEVAFKDRKMRYEIEGFHCTTPQLIEQEIIALMFFLLIESYVEEAAISTLPPEPPDIDDEHRPKRCNRAALGDRISTLINLAIRAKPTRHLWQEYERGINATARDRARICRTGRGRLRQCLSQFGRWRFRKSTATAA